MHFILGLNTVIHCIDYGDLLSNGTQIIAGPQFTFSILHWSVLPSRTIANAEISIVNKELCSLNVINGKLSG